MRIPTIPTRMVSATCLGDTGTVIYGGTATFLAGGSSWGASGRWKVREASKEAGRLALARITLGPWLAKGRCASMDAHSRACASPCSASRSTA